MHVDQCMETGSLQTRAPACAEVRLPPEPQLHALSAAASESNLALREQQDSTKASSVTRGITLQSGSAVLCYKTPRVCTLKPQYT